MSEIMLMLHLEHRNMERVLVCLEQRLEALTAGDDVDRVMLGSIIEYFRSFPDRCHHPKENLVYARLIRRCPAAAGPIGDLLSEHAARSRETDRLASLLDATLCGDEMARWRFAGAARAFVAGQRRHIEQEETHFFPAALRYLDADDREDIDFAVFDDLDPLFVNVAEERFRELRDLILSADPPAA